MWNGNMERKHDSNFRKCAKFELMACKWKLGTNMSVGLKSLNVLTLFWLVIKVKGSY